MLYNDYSRRVTKNVEQTVPIEINEAFIKIKKIETGIDNR